ncbi:hypothetical protein N7478_005483 [Penicillium angulare]|uniref:uncharacterized protein n=1 Tax=Penicillium angulare TaxID=116970 RepID=UPI002541C0E4|nr:uncharacterized protein N7478_005483 [Penicillium angulare]KAJ5280111.1 hypothetical protein N7478_005483 [Penicillium angulare]
MSDVPPPDMGAIVPQNFGVRPQFAKAVVHGKGINTFGNAFLLDFQSASDLALVAAPVARNVDWRDINNVKVNSKGQRRACVTQQIGMAASLSCTHCSAGHGPFLSCVVTVLNSGDVMFSGSCASCAYGNAASRCSFRQNPPKNLVRFMRDAYPTSYYCISRHLVEDPAAEEDDRDIDEASSPVITPRKRRVTASASSSKETTSPVSKKPRVNIPAPATPETSVRAKSVLSPARKTQKIQSPFHVASSSSPGPKGPVRATDVKRPSGPVYPTDWYFSPLDDRDVYYCLKTGKFEPMLAAYNQLSLVESRLAHDHARIEAVLKENNIIKHDESEAESEENPFALDVVSYYHMVQLFSLYM